MWERHLQTIIVTLTLGAIMFAGNWVFDKTRSDAREEAAFGAQLATLTAQVVELRADVRAFSTSFVRREEHQDHEQRLRALEGKIKGLNK